MHYDHPTRMYHSHNACIEKDHSRCMHRDHSTCMNYGRSTRVNYMLFLTQLLKGVLHTALLKALAAHLPHHSPLS